MRLVRLEQRELPEQVASMVGPDLRDVSISRHISSKGPDRQFGSKLDSLSLRASNLVDTLTGNTPTYSGDRNVKTRTGGSIMFAASEPFAEWIQMAMQGGALAILAYHFLVSLPAAIKDSVVFHGGLIKDLRESQERVVEKISDSANIRAERHSDAIRELAKATNDQTAAVTKKLDEIKMTTCQYLTLGQGQKGGGG